MSQLNWRTIVEAEEGIVDYESKWLSSNDSANAPKNTGILYKQAYNMLTPDTNKPLPRLKRKPRLKLTPYKLLQLSVVLSFGVVKAREMLQNGVLSTTWLEFLSSSILVAGTYWLGRYKRSQMVVALWFFHEDYLPDIPYATLSFLIVASFMTILNYLFWYFLESFLIINQHIFPDKPMVNKVASSGRLFLQWAFLLLWLPYLILGYMVVLLLAAIAVWTLLYFHGIFMRVPVYRRVYRRITRMAKQSEINFNHRTDKHPILYISVAVASLPAPVLLLAYRAG